MNNRLCIVTSYIMPIEQVPFSWTDTVKSNGIGAGRVFMKNKELWITLSAEHPFEDGLFHEDEWEYVTAIRLKAVSLLQMTRDCFSGNGVYAHFDKHSHDIILDYNDEGYFGRIVGDGNSKINRNSYPVKLLQLYL